MLKTTTFLLLLALIAPAFGQTYKWVDKDGKVHYSDKPPPAGAKQSTPITTPSAPRPASSEAKGKPEASTSAAKEATQASFRPEEQTALGTLCAIHLLQTLTCRLSLTRFCTFEELVNGIGGNPKKGLTQDPRADPNYEYRFEPRAEKFAVSAIPRKSGLTAFFNDENDTHYNANGPATKNDKRIQGGLSCHAFLK